MYLYVLSHFQSINVIKGAKSQVLGENLKILKGHYVRLERKFKLRFIHFSPWLNKQAVPRSLQIRSPEHWLQLERWQGPPHINKVKKYESVLSFKVHLFILYILCSAPLSVKSTSTHIVPCIRYTAHMGQLIIGSDIQHFHDYLTFALSNYQ